MLTDSVVEVRDPGSVDDPGEFEFDVVGAQMVEESPALAEQDGDDVDLHLVEQAGAQTVLGGIGAVQHHVAITRRGLGLGDGRFDAVGHVRDRRRAGRWVLGRLMGWDEDRHSIVMITVPVPGDVEGPTANEDRAGGDELVEHWATRAVGPVRARIAAAVGEPGVQPLSVDAEPVVGAVVGSGDESVEGHRHVEDEVPHELLRSFRCRRWAAAVAVSCWSAGRRGSPYRTGGDAWSALEWFEDAVEV